jgi:hypothetical protein
LSSFFVGLRCLKQDVIKEYLPKEFQTSNFNFHSEEIEIARSGDLIGKGI